MPGPRRPVAPEGEACLAPTLLRMKRLADPYRDLDVIDSRAPRFNQAVVGILAALAVVTGWWLILAVLAAQLAVGLTFGRRYCLPCLAYFELVQPRFGEGPLEDARPPRFANMVGVAFLSAAALSYAAGAEVVGRRARDAGRGACATGRGDRLLRRLRGIQARPPADGTPLRRLPAAAATGRAAGRRVAIPICVPRSRVGRPTSRDDRYQAVFGRPTWRSARRRGPPRRAGACARDPRCGARPDHHDRPQRRRPRVQPRGRRDLRLRARAGALARSWPRSSCRRTGARSIGARSPAGPRRGHPRAPEACSAGGSRSRRCAPTAPCSRPSSRSAASTWPDRPCSLRASATSASARTPSSC